MEIAGTTILDTHAEAFRMWGCRLIVTAVDRAWVDRAVAVATGYGTSVIGCDAEAGLERLLEPAQTPDGRPGAALLFFDFKPETLERAVANRAGQGLLTCPTTAVFDGLPGIGTGAGGGGKAPDVTAGAEIEDTYRLEIGDSLRHFGDGYETRAEHAGRSCWSIPVMDGRFLVEASAGAVKGYAGGNFLICGRTQAAALAAAQRAVAAIAPLADVMTPFPGGICRSGSKVGSRYPGMVASTNHLWCPDLRDLPGTQVPAGTQCVYEIVIDGLTLEALRAAMHVGIRAACGSEIVAVGAGNYGGRLGNVVLPLHEITGERV